MLSLRISTAITVLGVVACHASSPPAVDMHKSPSRVDAPAPEAGGLSCLMVNVCSCNLGCAAIRVRPELLHEGTQTTALSGALEGEEVKIVRVTDTSGASVLALTDLLHDQACSLAAERSLVGYGCAADKSGDVPAKACTHACE